MTLWYLLPLFLFAAFIADFKTDKTRLPAGLFLTASLLSLSVIFFLQAYFTDNRIMRIFAVAPILILFLAVTFGAYFLILFLILNTRIILKKEKRELKHVLTLAFAVILIIIVFTPRYMDFEKMSKPFVFVVYSAYLIVFYYLVHLAQFIISMFLCNISRPKMNQDYIIVLGCWVDNGRVTPILAQRLERAIAFYNKQKELGIPPKIVLSGGKGGDETCSEAEAMKEYVLNKGIPKEHILTEDSSVSTMQNMLFSKEIMDKDSGGKPYNCIYATNNYHVLRAGIYAKKAGLKINGIGAKTAMYYLPNAVLREYIAYIVMHLKWNVAFTASTLIIGYAAMYALYRLQIL